MKISKDHLDYWRGKLRKQKLPRAEWEQKGKAQNWEIYLQHRGRREWFNLRTPNKEAAASTAREIWRGLAGAGWQPILEKHKPAMAAVLVSPTVGEFLLAVERFGPLRSFTFETYARKLRTVVASVCGVPVTSARFDHRKGGYNAWRERVDAAKLVSITVFAVQEWKKETLNAAGDDPLSQMRTRRTINSIIRNAKSLFGEKVLKLIPVELVHPYPFEGVDFERVSKPRYRSRVDVGALISLAKEHLRKDDPECYKVFLLALTAGLRRKEIDGLLWSQINFERKTIRIETTAHTELKSEDSEEVIDIPETVAEELKQLQAAGFSDFVISASQKSKPKKPQRYPVYRCDVHFERLISWLRSNGITDDKPIHLLRKEFGCFIASKHGIFAASQALRHSSITTTRDHYLDKKEAVVFDMLATTKHFEKRA